MGCALRGRGSARFFMLQLFMCASAMRFPAHCTALTLAVIAVVAAVPAAARRCRLVARHWV